MECDPTPQSLLPGERAEHGDRRTLGLKLDGFTWEALTEQADELGVAVDELVAFSVLYYLADLDSKRIARRLPTDLRPPSARD
jgi:hypothetical protein